MWLKSIKSFASKKSSLGKKKWKFQELMLGSVPIDNNKKLHEPVDGESQEETKTSGTFQVYVLWLLCALAFMNSRMNQQFVWGQMLFSGGLTF